MVITVSQRSPSAVLPFAVLAVLAVAFIGYARSPAALTSTSADAIMIYCERTIKPGMTEKYKADWAAFSEHVMAKAPGVKALFSFMKKGEADKTLQMFYFDSVGAFFDQPQDKPELAGALWSNYGGTKETDVCQVFGGWTPTLKALAATLPGVRYVMKPGIAGYMLPGSSLSGTPIWFLSKRHIKPGHMASYAAGFQAVCEKWFVEIPGIIAAYDYVSEKNENTVYDVRLMANYDDGFVNHVKPSILGIILSRMFPNLADANFEDAVLFAAAGEQAKMVAINPGNAIYTEYTWDEVIGPMPDFSK